MLADLQRVGGLTPTSAKRGPRLTFAGLLVLVCALGLQRPPLVVAVPVLVLVGVLRIYWRTPHELGRNTRMLVLLTA